MARYRKCLGLLCIAVVPSPAMAQTTIDVSKISCEQFVLRQVADADYVAIWLSGYFNGKRNNTIVEIQQFKANLKKIQSYCLYNKGTLMDAVEKVLSSSN